MIDSEKIRHVCGISGGKDSAALAIYIKERGLAPDMEYFFSDTGAELPEVYDFLDKLEAYLGKEIIRLGSKKDFDHHLKLHGNFLPSPRQRWCTKEMKIRPFEEFVGDDNVISYVGIRADENRDGYISTKPNIKAVFPFKEDGLVRADVFRILEETVGIPEYYKWRSRSGCYFCFYQRRDEWIGLYKNHPDLFALAGKYEKVNSSGKRYTWIQGMSLQELIEKAADYDSGSRAKESAETWQEILKREDEEENDGCLICTL